MKYILTTAILMASLFVNAQINKPDKSPRVKIEQQVGLVNVSLDYSQPSKRNRSIFGSLIPFGEVWRTGANMSTKLTFDTDVKLASQSIPKGTYALYTIPSAEEWTIIIHKNSEHWGKNDYNAEEDLIRFKVPVIDLKDTVESLRINFENFTTSGGDLFIAWANTKIKIPLFVDSDELIFKEILEKTSDDNDSITAQTYYDAAKFYQSKEKDLDLALTWYSKAIELRPEAFWMVYAKAKLAFDMKDYKLAKKTAKSCNELAKESKSDYGYIAKSEALLKQIAEAK